jgi:choline-sulfatase
MIVTGEWKYIFMANGCREQLFNLKRDSAERSNCIASALAIRDDLYALAVEACRGLGAMDALDGDKLRSFPFRERTRMRICQFDESRGVQGFPDKPEDALKNLSGGALKRPN